MGERFSVEWLLLTVRCNGSVVTIILTKIIIKTSRGKNCTSYILRIMVTVAVKETEKIVIRISLLIG